MSFRELRSFTEIMRTLGYPRPISMENFRTPNFPLVADTLYWLVLRYDPTSKIPEDIDTEQHRIVFLTSVAQVLANKARILVKTKNLYAADGRAVKELLKIAKVLYNAMRACQEAIATGEDEEGNENESFILSIKPSDITISRTLASEVTTRGAHLHELLQRDTQELRGSRTAALQFLDAVSGSLDSRAESEYLERSVRDAIANTKDTIMTLEKQLHELTDDEGNIVNKINKRKTELERNQKRLESLQSVRPAFMDEYERLERELAEEHELYVTRYRNLDYLQHELEIYNLKEKEQAEASARALRKLQRKLKEEQNRLVRGDDMDEDGTMVRSSNNNSSSSGTNNKSSSSSSSSKTNPSNRPTGASGGMRPGANVSVNRPTGASVGVRSAGRVNPGISTANNGKSSLVSNGKSTPSMNSTNNIKPSVVGGSGPPRGVVGKMNAAIDDESSELSDDVDDDDNDDGLGDTGGNTDNDDTDF